MKIIGLSGKKQSGKTTAADFLSHMTKWPVLSIATPLKNIVKQCFGATEEQVRGTNEQKNTKLPCGKTARELLQIVGTDWFRELDAHCWLRCLEHQITLYGAEGIIIDDVKFANEVQWIQQHGHVIKLLRAPFSDKDKHASETELDDAPDSFFDAYLDNRAITIDYANIAIWELVCERKWIC